MSPLHPTLEAVTARIRERSIWTRLPYLARIERWRQSHPPRRSLSCTNLAHGCAAFAPDSKVALLEATQPNIAIVSSYNDMLSAHQPLDTKPGNTMVGTHLNRNITWAEQAAPLFTYFARECEMLQQGQQVADLAYLLNEGAPSTPPIWAAGTTPTPPDGYDFDFINADVLLHRMSVAEDGRLVLPDGMSYRVLVLPQTDRMRPELLRKIRELVLGGAVILGPKPEASPSLQNYPLDRKSVV